MSKQDKTNEQITYERRNFCKSVSKIIFSHIGSVIIVIVWVIIGGVIFQLLEKNKEIEDCQQGKSEENDNIILLRSKLLEYIQSNITSNPVETGKDNETVANSNIEKWLQEFRNQTIELRDDFRYTGSDCDQPKWNFPGSMLFAVTAITTIGYGNIAPVTIKGQVVCIVSSRAFNFNLILKSLIILSVTPR
jgi:potassium channel subfamily K, invertebrate